MMPEPQFESHPFWAYSLRLYPVIETWCLQRQDRHGANVNLLLLACYAGSQQRVLTEACWHSLVASIEPLNTAVILPLRTLRQELARVGEQAAWRERIKQIELNGERAIQQQLYQSWCACRDDLAKTDAQSAVRENVQRYLSMLANEPPTLEESIVTAAVAVAS